MNWTKSLGEKIELVAKSGLASTQDPTELARFQELEIIAKRILSNNGQSLNLAMKRFPQNCELRAVVFEEQHLLVTEEILGSGGWVLPGGFFQGESINGEVNLAQALQMIVAGQSGWEISPQLLLAIDQIEETVFRFTFWCKKIAIGEGFGLTPSPMKFIKRHDYEQICRKNWALETVPLIDNLFAGKIDFGQQQLPFFDGMKLSMV